MDKGTAYIVVYASGNNKAVCKVTVVWPVKSIKLNKTSITLKKGRTYKLIAKINPSDANNKKILWKSSNTKVATVSAFGLIISKGAGTATITATISDVYKTAKVKVTVKK